MSAPDSPPNENENAKNGNAEPAAVIHDVGYRPWNGQRTPQWSRWWIIAENGIKLVIKSRWVRRLLFFAWLPILYWGAGFFVVEQGFARQSTNLLGEFEEAFSDLDRPLTEEEIEEFRRRFGPGRLAEELKDQFRPLPKIDEVADAIQSGDTKKARHTVWAWLLMTYFRYPQGTLVLFLLGFIAPGLISRDVRSRAFLLYFSRPIGRVEYVLGKLAIPTTYVALISLVPAMALYLFALMMSPDLSVFWETWDVIPRIFLASLCLIIPTAALSLMLSSLTHESRFASFAWFAIWALGHGAWFAILISQAIRLDRPPPEVLDNVLVQRWSVLSLYNNFGDVQSWVFGFDKFADIWPSFGALALVSVVSFVILYRRVSAPIRI